MKIKKNTGNSSLMIRMIDVVFILLFGFIAVSQISRAEQIDPAKSTEAEDDAPKGAEIVIIGVRTDGTYSAEGGEETFRSTGSLRRYLKRRAAEIRAEGKKIGVRIRANYDAPTQRALAAAKVCKELGIPKGLDVIKVRGQ